MANRDILAVGTSAGGVEALIHVAKGLPCNLPASVLLTIHLPGHARSALDDVLTRAGLLPASFAEDGEVVRKSRIYIAPPDRHLLLDGDHITVVQDPKDAAFAEQLARSIGYEVEIARGGQGGMEQMDAFGRRSVLGRRRSKNLSAKWTSSAIRPAAWTG